MHINNYDEKADTYAGHSKDEGTISMAYKALDNLIDGCKKKGAKNALDFGCGVGRSRKYLEELGLDADGVDIDAAMIRTAKELDNGNAGKYQLINNSIIPQRASKYDVVFSSLVVLEMGSKAEIAQYFSEASRVMKFDGTFVVLTVNDDFYKHQWTSVDTNYPGNSSATSGDRVRVKIKEIDLELDDFYWMKSDYREIAELSGFTIIEEIEPRAIASDNSNWISECEHSPYVIFVMKKTKSLEPINELSGRLGLNIEIPGRGVFSETFRSAEIISQSDHPTGYSGERNAKASIRLLMKPGDFWPFHRLKSSEIFRHIEGNDLLIHMIDFNGKYDRVYLGGEQDSAVKEFKVPDDCWYAEESLGTGGYTLIEAATYPGFHPDDLIEASKQALLSIIANDDVELMELINRFCPN